MVPKGVCRIPENAKLFTAQRFDEYDGVSWMVHTDGNQEWPGGGEALEG